MNSKTPVWLVFLEMNAQNAQVAVGSTSQTMEVVAVRNSTEFVKLVPVMLDGALIVALNTSLTALESAVTNL